jgi:phage/plasmid-like protein (TIGR03299 family)
MAHEITSSDKVAFVGARPWHGIGVEVNEDVAKDVDAFCTLVAPWEPIDQPVYYKNDIGEYVEFDDYKARLRSDTRLPLGVVGIDHTAWGNRQLFNWFKPFIDKDLLRFETGGTLRGGKLVWALAKANISSEVVAGDKVERYLMVSNGHGGNGGTHAIRIGFTDIRIVCSNTLHMAYESQASKLIRIKHRKNVITTVEQVRDVIDIANREFVATSEQYRKLAQTSVNVEDLRRYVKQVLGVTPEQEKAGLSTRLLNTIDKIVEFSTVGRGAAIPGVAGTLWGAYNGVTEWTTWERGHNADTRLQSLWFGQSAELNKVALETAIAMAV